MDDAKQHDLTARRVAQNQSAFRAANEEIEAAAEAMAPDLPRIPFVCECHEPSCTHTARLRLDEYERVRSDSTHFFVVPGHEVCTVDGQEVARIVAHEAGFTIMEKVGIAGEEAARLDARTGQDERRSAESR